MSACDHCYYRNSWECDDMLNRRKSCDGFLLDFGTLTEKQKRTIRKILDREDKE